MNKKEVTIKMKKLGLAHVQGTCILYLSLVLSAISFLEYMDVKIYFSNGSSFDKATPRLLDSILY